MLPSIKKKILSVYRLKAEGITDYQYKMKDTLIFQELEPAFNVNIENEKLLLYLFIYASFSFYSLLFTVY